MTTRRPDERKTHAAHATAQRPWSPDSWRERPAAQEVRYLDESALDTAVEKLKSLPPLVTSWEIEHLRSNIAEAQEGKRFLLQGGDCAESLDDCRPEVITNKLKILLQMSLVLVHGGMKPVIRVGRFAGQYAKPRSAPEETATGADGVERTLPSYFGDLVNRPDFDENARRADPTLLVQAYEHAAMTINFIRALTAGGFADLHHPEYWNLGFLSHADLPADIRAQYEQTTARLADALRFMEALGETSVDELTRVDFFTSHEGLNLVYESAQTRTVPRRDGHYDLTTHMPWIGERTRDIGGAHVEFFRGVRNPVGVKLGPTAEPDDIVDLCHALNPDDEPGRLVLICRMGAKKVGEALPPLIEAVQRADRRVLWVCDPMHANTIKTAGGVKTRNFDEIIREIEQSFDIHDDADSRLGGVHFELTGEDVTECVGGAAGVTEKDLDRNYTSRCDPRLNYSQSLEMAFRIAARMRNGK